MNKLCAYFIAALISFPCYASTDRSTAENWLDEFDSAQAKTSDALFLNDPVKRKGHTQTLMKLHDRADKYFGAGSDCSTAANSLVEMWLDEIELARDSSNAYITASSLAGTAWNAGQYYATCRDQIDSIK